MCQTPGAGIRLFLTFNLALNSVSRAARRGINLNAGETFKRRNNAFEVCPGQAGDQQPRGHENKRYKAGSTIACSAVRDLDGDATTKCISTQEGLTTRLS